jgi:HlyD family secretion protein
VQVDRDLASDVAKDLREADAKIGEFLERRITAEDQLSRVDIRAPIAGTAHQSTVFTIGGVIPANGEPLMLIVPDDDKLMVETKVAPQDIDQLRIGQTAALRFSSFNQRTTPEINGELARISADAMTNQRSGATYTLSGSHSLPRKSHALATSSPCPGRGRGLYQSGRAQGLELPC